MFPCRIVRRQLHVLTVSYHVMFSLLLHISSISSLFYCSVRFSAEEWGLWGKCPLFKWGPGCLRKFSLSRHKNEHFKAFYSCNLSHASARKWSGFNEIKLLVVPLDWCCCKLKFYSKIPGTSSSFGDKEMQNIWVSFQCCWPTFYTKITTVKDNNCGCNRTVMFRKHRCHIIIYQR